jgi:ABC-2 type transport system permease protein
MSIPSTMTTLFFFISLVTVFILSSILSLLVYSVVGLLSFWIEDIKPLYWIVDKAVMILGGSYLPVALFPPLMYKIAVWSPFGASQFITHIVYETWKVDYIKMLGIQAFWIVVLSFIVVYMFGRAYKKVSVNGG